MSEQDDVLRDALAGIKVKKTRKRISRFNASDGITAEIEEGKTHVPGKGIVHVQDVKEIILDCRHSSRFGIGHIADCGHAVCALCAEKLVLECAKPGCFRKLCTVRGCFCCARYVDAVFFCKKHYFWARIDSFGCSLLYHGKEWEERASVIADEYYSRRLQLRGEK